jgi:uncharacterized YigZ family protein
MEITEYNTLTKSTEGYYKNKGSKFIAVAYYVENEDDVKNAMALSKKKYYDARHHCYAYRITPEKEYTRSSDDGEPSGTAGKPILNQILSYGLYNVLIVVVRYFGGTKLGVSGLILAYKSATRDLIQGGKVSKVFITRDVELSFEYPLMNSVMKVIKDEKLIIFKQDFTTDCKISVKIKKDSLKNVLGKMGKIRRVVLTEL